MTESSSQSNTDDVTPSSSMNQTSVGTPVGTPSVDTGCPVYQPAGPRPTPSVIGQQQSQSGGGLISAGGDDGHVNNIDNNYFSSSNPSTGIASYLCIGYTQPTSCRAVRVNSRESRMSGL